jgi:hypothetical protein
MVLLTEEDKVLVAGVDTVLVAREEDMVLVAGEEAMVLFILRTEVGMIQWY